MQLVRLALTFSILSSVAAAADQNVSTDLSIKAPTAQELRQRALDNAIHSMVFGDHSAAAKQIWQIPVSGPSTTNSQPKACSTSLEQAPAEHTEKVSTKQNSGPMSKFAPIAKPALPAPSCKDTK